MTKIKDYMKPKETDLKLIQAWIPKEIAVKIRKIMDREHWTWSETVEACFKRLIDEEKRS